MKKISKWLATTLVLTTALAPTAVLAAPPVQGSVTQQGSTEGIVDLQKADGWAQAAIVQAKQLGLMSGDPSGNFRPTDTITRAEFAVMLTRLLQLPVPAAGTSSFSDVSAGHWGLSYIEAVQEAGLMLGDGDGTFRPDDVITREELAVLLVKAAQGDAEVGELPVADGAEVSSWAKGYVQAAISMGLMSGDGQRFHPKQAAVRQEVAMVAVNFVNKMPGQIDIVADSQVTVKGIPYPVVDSLKPLFQLRNSDALKNAKMRFEVKDNRITKVTYLELTNAGHEPGNGEAEFSGNRVLDAGNATVDGHVKIAADYVTVQNLNIAGDLEIGANVGHDFYSRNVKVGGKTWVNGGDANTVAFDGATLGSVEVNKADVHVQATGGTKVDELLVRKDAHLEAGTGVTLPRVVVDLGVHKLKLDGQVTTVEVNLPVQTTISGQATIGKLNVTDKQAKLTLQVGTKVQQLQLPAGVQASDVIANYDQAKSQIVVVTTGSNSTGGGGNGGGNSGGNGGDNGNGNGGDNGGVVQTTAPSAANISVHDSVNSTDSIVVKSVPAQTTVRVYDALTGGNLLGTIQQSRNSASDVEVILAQSLPANLSNVYVTFQTGTQTESKRIEKHYLAGLITDVNLKLATKPGAHAFATEVSLAAGHTLAELSGADLQFLTNASGQEVMLADTKARDAYLTAHASESKVAGVATREQKASDVDANWSFSSWTGTSYDVPDLARITLTDRAGNVYTSTQAKDLTLEPLAALNGAADATALQAVLEDAQNATAFGIDTATTSFYGKLLAEQKTDVMEQLLATRTLQGSFKNAEEVRTNFSFALNGQSRMTLEELLQAIGAALNALPQPGDITEENLSAVRLQVELAESMVAEALARGVMEDQLPDRELLKQDRERIITLTASIEYAKYLQLANVALAALPEAADITYANLNSLTFKINAATEAVKAARGNGALTGDFVGFDKLVRVIRLKTDLLFVIDSDGEVDKTQLAADFTEEKLFDVADQFEALIDYVPAIAANNHAQRRHEVLQAMQQIKAMSFTQDIYEIADDVNLAYALYLVPTFIDSVNDLPDVDHITMEDKGTVSFLLQYDNDLTMFLIRNYVYLPNMAEYFDAESKLYELTGKLASQVVEALFADSSHSQLAEGVDLGGIQEATLYTHYADYDEQDALYELIDQAQQLFADGELVVPELVLVWNPKIPSYEQWNNEIVAGDSINVIANKRSKLYLVPTTEHPQTTLGLEGLVLNHKATVVDVTGAGAGLVGELSSAGLALGEYTIYLADAFGHVRQDSTTYTIVENVVPYVVWPLRDLNLQADGSMARVDLRYTFQDTEDDTLTYDGYSSNPDVVDVVVEGSNMRVIPLSPGTATITVIATDSRGAKGTTTFKITVTPADPPPPEEPTDPETPVLPIEQGVTLLADQTATVGQPDLTLSLTQLLTTENGQSAALTWTAANGQAMPVLLTSENEAVATVSLREDNTLVVHALAVGQSKILVQVPDGQGGCTWFAFQLQVL